MLHLGLDFLAAKEVMINTLRRMLLYNYLDAPQTLKMPADPFCSISVETSLSLLPSLVHVPTEARSSLYDLLKVNSAAFASSMSDLRAAKGIVHEIKTKGPPVFQPMRRVGHALRSAGKAKIFLLHLL